VRGALERMSSKLIGLLLILAVGALVPLGLIALSRSRPSPNRPVHLVFDMDKQPKFKGQRPSPMFADGRAMRPRIAETLAREDLTDGRGGSGLFSDAAEYDRVVHGVNRQAGGKMDYVTTIPLPVTMELMRRGQDRFNIYCSACHGLSGYGDGPVARRAAEMQAAGSSDAAGWVAPSSYHTDQVRQRPVGYMFNTITNGIRTMPAHGVQVPVNDRWAIVAYVKALQRSQNAKSEEVPDSEKKAAAASPTSPTSPTDKTARP